MKKEGYRKLESPDNSWKFLRQRAEEIVRKREGCLSEDAGAMEPGAMRQKLHELLVHQIELEMQNDELRRAQVELEDARARYLDLYDLAPVGYCTISEKGLILEINLTASTLLGVPRGALIDKPLSRFIFKEDQDIYYLRRRQIFETGEPQAYDLRMTKCDGTVFWAHLDAISLQAEEGLSVCRLALSDITERKKVDEALRESEEKLRAILENSHEGINMLNLTTGRYEYMNPAQVEMMGFTQEEMNNYSAEEACARVHPEDRQLSIEQQEQIASGLDTLREIEYRWKVKSGEYRWFNDRRKLIKDPGGRPLASIGISRDITDNKQAEASMSALVEQLRQADRNKNDFISMLSHELRNPLAAILAGVSLLDITDDVKKTDIAKEVMKRQTAQLCRLVDDLLDLTRINTNKIQLKKEHTELCKLVNTVAGDYEAQFEEKGVMLEVVITTGPLILEADPARITQIIENLLHNALKFTSAGGTTILTLNKNKSNAVICVKDTGIGIKPEILPKLFQPFVQLDNSLDRSNGGLGLGLAIVKGMAELHRGSVSAFSEGLGKGTQFTILLPLSSEEENKQEEKHPEGKVSRSLRILYIEDNTDLADILCSMLEQFGHETASVCNGIDGIAKAREFLPDVILCDIGLPGMNGYEVARIIREDNRLKEAYLIALSGYAGKYDIDNSKKSGFDHHVAKPVDIETLKKILADVS